MWKQRSVILGQFLQDLETQGQTSKSRESVKGERQHGRGGGGSWAAPTGWGVCLDLGRTDPRVTVSARGSGRMEVRPAPRFIRMSTARLSAGPVTPSTPSSLEGRGGAGSGNP